MMVVVVVVVAMTVVMVVVGGNAGGDDGAGAGAESTFCLARTFGCPEPPGSMEQEQRAMHRRHHCL